MKNERGEEAEGTKSGIVQTVQGRPAGKKYPGPGELFPHEA